MNEKQGLEKNYFIAIALSALVLFVYFSLVKQPQSQTQTQVQNEAESKTEITSKNADLASPNTATVAVQTGELSAKATEIKASAPANLIKLESPTLSVELSDLGATATRLHFKGEPTREMLTQTSFFEKAT